MPADFEHVPAAGAGDISSVNTTDLAEVVQYDLSFLREIGVSKLWEGGGGGGRAGARHFEGYFGSLGMMNRIGFGNRIPSFDVLRSQQKVSCLWIP